MVNKDEYINNVQSRCFWRCKIMKFLHWAAEPEETLQRSSCSQFLSNITPSIRYITGRYTDCLALNATNQRFWFKCIILTEILNIFREDSKPVPSDPRLELGDGAGYPLGPKNLTTA